jgi:preprotein translocase subunit SecA
MLMVIDDKWKDHLYFMDHLKDSIGFRGYAQQDPLVEYKKEGYMAFAEMIDNINADVISLIFKAEMRTYQEERKQVIRRKEREMANIQTHHQESTGMGVKTVAKQQSTEESEEGGEEQEVKTERVKLKPIQRTQPKVGRNDPCPCGSGKKYKKCCGKNI